MSEIQNKEEIYIEAMILIAGLSQNDSVSAVFDKISKIPEDLTLKDAILVELDKNRIFSRVLYENHYLPYFYSK